MKDRSAQGPGLGTLLRKVRAGAVLALAACSCAGSHPAPSAARSDAVDWPVFLARLDPLWNTLPPKWDSAALTGNGLMGATVFLTDDGKALRWHMGRTDVIFANERIPVGDLIVASSAALQGGQLRLDLWNAEVTGSLQTSAGAIRIRSFTHTDELVQVIELIPDPGSSYALDWSPGLAISTRTLYGCASPACDPAALPRPNPPPQRRDEGSIHLSTQRLTAPAMTDPDGGGHTTAWIDVPRPDGSHVVYVSVGFSRPGSGGDGSVEAVGNLQRAVASGVEALLATHRAWWHRFWQASFLSIPDTRLEAFYWNQVYKMASASRPGRPQVDLLGPWFRDTCAVPATATLPPSRCRTPWPYYWWNLNTQLTYWIQLASNRLELGESLFANLDAHRAALATNAAPFQADSFAIGGHSSGFDYVRPIFANGDVTQPSGYETGNLTWALHNYYLQYRFSMDEAMLRDRLYPLLKGSINLYLHLLAMGPDGYLHMPIGYSPEYPTVGSNCPAGATCQHVSEADTNYDLALIRWGCRTLLDIVRRLRLDDPQAAQWEETLRKLLPYPTDENGFAISATVPFALSHRHYSHLLMVYPLYLVTPENADDRLIIQRSLDHWMGLTGALRGYSYTGAASISALLGRGDDAARYLNQLLDQRDYPILPNTLYAESGPVIETPLSGAAALHDMLLTSWGGKIRVLPGVPEAWRDVSFRDLRTEGAFLVSAVRKEGALRLIRIHSLAGEPCHLVTDMPDPRAMGATLMLTRTADREYDLPLEKGQTVVLTPGGIVADTTIAAQPSDGRDNYFGLRCPGNGCAPPPGPDAGADALPASPDGADADATPAIDAPASTEGDAFSGDAPVDSEPGE